MGKSISQRRANKVIPVKMKLISFGLLIMMMMLSVGEVSASDISKYSTEMDVFDEAAYIETIIVFESPYEGEYVHMIPIGYDRIEVLSEHGEVPFIAEEGSISIDAEGAIGLMVTVISRSVIDRQNVVYAESPSVNVKDYSLSLTLADGQSLRQAIDPDDMHKGTIFPKPDRVSSDGRNIEFIWSKASVGADEELNYYLNLEKAGNASMMMFGIMFIIVLGGIVFILFLKRREPVIHPDMGILQKRIVDGSVKVQKKDDMTEDDEDAEKVFRTSDKESEDDIRDSEVKFGEGLNHLKEDEEQIISILQMKEGACEQGTLRVITGHSKATLSRLLMELEARKFIYKEKRGKKNLIFLK